MENLRKHLVVCLLTISCVLAIATVRAQLPVQGRRQIPEVEVPCTPEEAKWWNEVHEVGNEVRKSRGEKKSKRLIELIKVGKENSYQPPVADRKPTVLVMNEPQYSEAARRDRISGRIQLQVEFQSNGTVGEVVVVNGIRPDLDRNAIDAARRTAFLPAIKNRQFETYWMAMEMNFSIY